MGNNFLKIFVVFAFTSILSSVALAQQSPQINRPNPEDIKHGAVLCVWTIYLLLKEFGEKCPTNKDPEFQAALEKSIDLADQFIIDNMPTTRENLEKSKQSRPFLPPLGSICNGDSRQLYENIQKLGPEAMRHSVQELLAVPRKPMMAPCL